MHPSSITSRLLRTVAAQIGSVAGVCVALSVAVAIAVTSADTSIAYKGDYSAAESSSLVQSPDDSHATVQLVAQTSTYERDLNGDGSTDFIDLVRALASTEARMTTIDAAGVDNVSVEHINSIVRVVNAHSRLRGVDLAAVSIPARVPTAPSSTPTLLNAIAATTTVRTIDLGQHPISSDAVHAYDLCSMFVPMPAASQFAESASLTPRTSRGPPTYI